MTPKRTLCIAAAAVAALTASPAGSGTPAGYSPQVTNPWFPLRAGTELVYTGTKDGKATRDVVLVTRRTIVIAGARCAVVQDLLYEAGKLEERTLDYYAQDRAGNVWYFGEDTAELDAQGRVTSREGTWRAGRNGAKAGVYMPAHPTVGQTGRQEYYKGHAEDHFRVVSLDTTVRVPFVTSHAALETREWTPLEPGTLDQKLYVRGIGTVKEASLKGPVERNTLVARHRLR
jgi:hypothetical protein